MSNEYTAYKLIADITGTVFGLIAGVAIVASLLLWKHDREQQAAVDYWTTAYTEMVKQKDEEIQHLKWLYRTTPPQQEKPRPKGRG
jgi:hypothetical protein